MKFNKGSALGILIFFLSVASIGAAVYIEPNHYGLIKKIPLLSFLDKKEVVEIVSPPVPLGPLPKVDAGPDISIKYPTDSVTLKGLATTDNGGLISYQWFKLSGGLGTILSPVSDTTIVKGLKDGKYSFRLIATDEKGLKSADEVVVTMTGGPVVAKAKKKLTPKTIAIKNTTPTQIQTPNFESITQLFTPPEITNSNPPNQIQTQNIPPTSNAGPDQNITLPNSSATLYGSGNDQDGNVSSYFWTQASGSGAVINSLTEATTTVSGLTEGYYVFQLIVTDNSGEASSDDVAITVNKGTILANIIPSADAGPDQDIILPESTATLYGSGTDTDGTIVSYLWTLLEGGSAIITSPSSPITTITGLTEGSYVFEFKVTDDRGSSDISTVAVNVNVAE